MAPSIRDSRVLAAACVLLAGPAGAERWHAGHPQTPPPNYAGQTQEVRVSAPDFHLESQGRGTYVFTSPAPRAGGHQHPKEGSELKGRRLVLVFWHHWPERSAGSWDPVDHLKVVHDRYFMEKGVRALAFGMNTEVSTEQAAKYPFPVGRDTNAAAQGPFVERSKQLGISGLTSPFWVVVDESGSIRGMGSLLKPAEDGARLDRLIRETWPK